MIKKRYILFITAGVILLPILVGQVIRIPTGQYTIGSEDSWVSFLGSFLGGVFGTLGVVFTTWILVKNNETIMKDSLKLEDRHVREREISVFIINKSEETATLIGNTSIEITSWITKNVQIAMKQDEIDYMVNIRLHNRIPELKAEVEFIKKDLDSMLLPIQQKLKEATAKAQTLENDIQKDIENFEKFLLIEQDNLVKQVKSSNSDEINEIGKILYKKVEVKVQDLQTKLSGLINKNLDILKRY